MSLLGLCKNYFITEELVPNNYHGIFENMLSISFACGFSVFWKQCRNLKRCDLLLNLCFLSVFSSSVSVPTAYLLAECPFLLKFLPVFFYVPSCTDDISRLIALLFCLGVIWPEVPVSAFCGEGTEKLRITALLPFDFVNVRATKRVPRSASESQF